MAEPAAKPGGISSALRDQLALVTFVVLFAGLVATDTYYAGFGIRFQVLDLSVSYLVYRGLTAAFGSHALIAIYLLCVIWLSLASDYLPASRRTVVRALVRPVTYALVLLVVVTTYLAAAAAGRVASQRDQTQSSELPVVEAIAAADGKALPFQGFRLLTVGKDTIVLFKPSAGTSEIPLLHILRREATGEITIARQ